MRGCSALVVACGAVATGAGAGPEGGGAALAAGGGGAAGAGGGGAGGAAGAAGLLLADGGCGVLGAGGWVVLGAGGGGAVGAGAGGAAVAAGGCGETGAVSSPRDTLHQASAASATPIPPGITMGTFMINLPERFANSNALLPRLSATAVPLGRRSFLLLFCVLDSTWPGTRA